MLKELLQLEHAGWSALCEGTGGASVMSRDEVVLALGSSPPWQSYEIDVPRVVPIGDDAYALIYRGTGRRPDRTPFVAMMTSVYVRAGDDWKLALFQQTPCATDAG
jgi:hypothetical protein